VTQELAALLTGLSLAAAAFVYVSRRLRATGQAERAAQRAAAHEAGLDTYTPQTQDREWSDWAGHHGGL